MRRASLLLALLPALAAACGLLEPGHDPTQLYVLATIAELEPARAPAPEADGALGIGPTSFPDYLRAELVSRRDVTVLEPARYERWGEPLDEAIPRVLSSNLAFLTGVRTIAYPWFESDAPRASVRIRFERFELEERARAVVVATWSLADERGRIVHEHRSQIVRALEDKSGATASLELSRALAELCLEIASAWTSAAAGAGSP